MQKDKPDASVLCFIYLAFAQLFIPGMQEGTWQEARRVLICLASYATLPAASCQVESFFHHVFHLLDQPSLRLAAISQ